MVECFCFTGDAMRYVSHLVTQSKLARAFTLQQFLIETLLPSLASTLTSNSIEAELHYFHPSTRKVVSDQI